MNDRKTKVASTEEILSILGTMGTAQLANIVDVGDGILKERQLDVVLDFVDLCKMEANCVIPHPKNTKYFDIVIVDTSEEKIKSATNLAVDILSEGEIPYTVNISKVIGEPIKASITIVFSHPVLHGLHNDMADDDSLNLTEVSHLIRSLRKDDQDA